MDKVPECVPELCFHVLDSNDPCFLAVSAGRILAVSLKGTDELVSLRNVDGCIASVHIRKLE